MEGGTNWMAIRRLLEAYPGLHLREVARRLEVDVRTAAYHLDRLERAGYLSPLRLGGHKRYFPRRAREAGEVVDRRDKPLLSHLRSPVVLSLVLQLLTLGPRGLTALAEEGDLAPSRARYHLAKLVRAGIVRHAENGAPYALREPDRIRDLLWEYGPPRDQVEGFLDLWEMFVHRD